ncbi:transcriptional regulator, TetR family [Ferrithrix thermotolerans DSM 19514]|uniref:Transcriptional regulator, TetR family n=1 Tax=Ferrithrix thermotolerans DSM 19514 TaxID=1121881 RepID=A0A1M4XJM8_9ACTN|nr:TetR/AcrR family transcriptional regulator [Ferrithrix thermotolerans]SHE93719.1 transcriptional regulator, TetR family [Ferrithrix thermotolerans DSM 19514]
MLEASAKAYSLYGYKETTIAHIAEIAGVTERTFYRYFANKEAPIIEELSRLNELFLSLLDQEPIGLELLDAVDRVLSVMNPRFGMAASAMVIVSGQSYDDQLSRDLGSLSWHYEEKLEAEFEKRIGKGFPEIDSEEARVYATAIARAVVGGIRFALLECAYSGIEDATKSPLFMQSYRKYISVYERSCRLRPALVSDLTSH